MNIDDVKVNTEEFNGDKLIAMFNRQKELMEKYHEIEKASGVGYGLLKEGESFHLDNQRSQELCKNFAWRVTEELTESFEAKVNWDRHHQFEELADALHFMLELLLVNNINYNDMMIASDKDKLERLFNIIEAGDYFRPIYLLGLAMNCLKQKPWKQTHVLTDSTKFRLHLVGAFYAIIGTMKCVGMDAKMCYEYYFKKSEVNKFRQRSQY